MKIEYFELDLQAIYETVQFTHTYDRTIHDSVDNV